MKLAIKNLKHSPFASQETECFEASVYVDGKRAFRAFNEGHGGCHAYHAFSEPGRALLRKARRWASEQPRVPYGHGMDGDFQPGLDWFISSLVADELQIREHKKAYRKGVAFVMDDDPGTIHWCKFPRGASEETKRRCRLEWPGKIREDIDPKTARFILADGSLEERAES